MKEYIPLSHIRIKLKKTTLYQIGIGIFLLLMLLVVLFLPKKQQTNPSTAHAKPVSHDHAETVLYFVPSTLIIASTTPTSQTIDLHITTGHNKIYGADVELVYNPQALQNLQIT